MIFKSEVLGLAVLALSSTLIQADSCPENAAYKISGSVYYPQMSIIVGYNTYYYYTSSAGVPFTVTLTGDDGTTVCVSRVSQDPTPSGLACEYSFSLVGTSTQSLSVDANETECYAIGVSITSGETYYDLTVAVEGIAPTTTAPIVPERSPYNCDGLFPVVTYTHEGSLSLSEGQYTYLYYEMDATISGLINLYVRAEKNFESIGFEVFYTNAYGNPTPDKNSTSGIQQRSGLVYNQYSFKVSSQASSVDSCLAFGFNAEQDMSLKVILSDKEIVIPEEDNGSQDKAILGVSIGIPLAALAVCAVYEVRKRMKRQAARVEFPANADSSNET